MQMAGKTTRCGSERTYFWPSAIRLPQEARGGWTPTPMYARVASARIAPGDAQRDRDDDRADPVGQQVPGHDPGVRHADGPGRLDELGLLERQQLAADEPRDGHPRGQADGHEDEEQAVERLAEDGLAEGDRQQDDEQQVGEGVDHVGEAHQEVVQASTEPAGERSDRHADREDHDLDDEGDGHADPGTVEQPAEEVAAQLIRAQDVVGRERRQRPVVGEDRLEVLDLVGPGRDDRAEDPGQKEQRDEDQAEDGQPVLEQPAERIAPQAGTLPGPNDEAPLTAVLVAISRAPSCTGSGGRCRRTARRRRRSGTRRRTHTASSSPSAGCSRGCRSR